MAKLKRSYVCKFCIGIRLEQDEFIRHLESHVRDLARKLEIVIQ